MAIMSVRFGSIEAGPEESIELPGGIVGFPNEKEFVLIPHGRSSTLGWLQSKNTPAFALPVVSAHGFGNLYPDVPLDDVARQVGAIEADDEVAVLVVLSAPNAGPATVNLLAPIVVNVATRKGAQLLLEGTRFSTRELFKMPHDSEPETLPAPPLVDSEQLQAIPAE